nr:Cap protein [egret CRESS-DNA virus]
MAYHKRRRTRRKRQVFSKRQKQAIERIAVKPAETKHMDENWQWTSLLNQAGYTGGGYYACRGSIFNQIPRENNLLTKSEHTFVGNQILLRGFRWEFMGYPETAVALPDVRFRFTVYEDPIPYTTLPVTTNAVIYDPDFSTTPTWARWNPQTTRIRYQRLWTLGQSSVGASNIHRKFWIPLRRKLTSSAEETTVSSNQFFGPAKEVQIYWVLEVLAPGMTTINTQINGYVQTTVYFKDP